MTMQKKSSAKVTAAKKAVPAKKTTKMSAPKETAAKKAVAPLLPKNIKYDDALTKATMYNTMADATGLSRKQVVSVFDCLGQIIKGHIRPKAIGVCSIAGLLKIEVKQKAATKARKGKNPFTGEEIMIKAKPARQVVKLRALKKLKEMAS
ncbi:MAG: integration host factor [Legionellales bacterium]|nr:integration host factor [Legionellales bacterium]